MADEIPMDTRLARTSAMKKLTQSDRAELIGAADNVIGFQRFQERSKQVEMSRAYSRPQKPPPGGIA